MAVPPAKHPDEPRSRLRVRVRPAVAVGVARWQAVRRRAPHRPVPEAQEAVDAAPRTRSEVLQPLPRRAKTLARGQVLQLPMAGDGPVYRANWLRAAARLFRWLFMMVYFLGGTLVDKLLRRDSVPRRAVRLRRAFETAGGTFVKFGQQMAMRIDLLPWAYTVELAKMLDQVPPFPLAQALAVIERTTGKRWDEVFAVFDPEPIGSASVACVYQAVLKNGEKVAVKVRRPGITELFMADFQVMDWLMDLMEFFTVLRPGFTRNIRREFKLTLLEELDFVQEARFQSMFRRSARKTGQGFFTAPRIYHQYSSGEVIVQKFTSGMWLWEVMAGVEQRNPQALKRMAELSIDPHRVAQRLLWVNYWGMQENLFFHADPHPANILVRKNSQLTFVDFGSCGSFNREQRRALEMIALGSGQNNAELMARGAMKLFEPLPPVDIRQILQEAEAEYSQVLTIYRSKHEHTEWWERTSVRQWLSFFEFAREHNIPVAIHTLRMVRATLLYDTVAVRLSKEIDRFEEYLSFNVYRQERARRRVRGVLRQQLRYGARDTAYLRVEELTRMGQKLLYNTQSLLDSPVFNFGSLVGKWGYAIAKGVQMAWQMLLVTLAGGLAAVGLQAAAGQAFSARAALGAVVGSPVYQGVLLLLLLVNIRHILFRLSDSEIG